MSKLGTGLATAGLLGAAALGILALDGASGPVASAEDEQYRYAIGDKQCLIDEGFDADRLNQVCASWEVQGNYVGCVRPRLAPVHKCEFSRDSLPDAAFRKLMGCRCTVDGETTDRVGLRDLDWTPPANCNCITICPKVINSKSRSNVWSELEQCLEEKCPGCDITPTHWGPCPHCLAPGRDCATECAEGG